MPEPADLSTVIPDFQTRLERTRARLSQRPKPPPPGVPLSDEEALAAERRWDARIPARYRHARIGQLEGDLADAKTWDRRSDVLLLGNVGAGKTHAAVALARVAHEAGGEVLFRPALALLDDLKPGDDDRQALRRALSADVLVLDDLGTERQTDWSADRISRLLVERYDDCKPTIVTSNLPPEGFEAHVGARIWSRLYQDALRILTADADRRRR